MKWFASWNNEMYGKIVNAFLNHLNKKRCIKSIINHKYNNIKYSKTTMVCFKSENDKNTSIIPYK